MSEIPFYIEMDEEIEDLLASNGMNIREILHREGIDARVKYGPVPYADTEASRTKDVATIIFASAAAAYLISKAITNVLKEIHDKPVYDEYYELVPVRDAKGNPIKDNETGEIIMTPQKFHFIHEFGKTPGEEKSEMSAGLKGLVMKFQKKQMPESKKGNKS